MNDKSELFIAMFKEKYKNDTEMLDLQKFLTDINWGSSCCGNKQSNVYTKEYDMSVFQLKLQEIPIFKLRDLLLWFKYRYINNSEKLYSKLKYLYIRMRNIYKIRIDKKAGDLNSLKLNQSKRLDTYPDKELQFALGNK